MQEYKTNFWDERFSGNEYVYGTEPNHFFKEQLDKIDSAGKLLLPGEGEGRNAVYAAMNGWSVDAFDQSKVAKLKAENLAEMNKVSINYQVIDLGNFRTLPNYYDCAAIIFVHLPESIRNAFHKKLIDSIKPGGRLILELYSKNQLGKNSGGPQEITMLSSIEEIKNDFNELNIILLTEENIFLNEGEKHIGEASVIRFVGQKIIK